MNLILKLILIIFCFISIIYINNKNNNKFNNNLLSSARFDIDSLYIDTLKINRNDSIIDSKLNIPNENPLNTKIIITSIYGYRIHPTKNINHFHNGIDIRAKEGTQVYSTAAGIVEHICYGRKGYGNYIVINHLNGYRTLYAHLKPNFNVMEVSFIETKTHIGYVGRSGATTGYHLHYTIFYNNKTVNPELYIKK